MAEITWIPFAERKPPQIECRLLATVEERLYEDSKPVRCIKMLDWYAIEDRYVIDSQEELSDHNEWDFHANFFYNGFGSKIIAWAYFPTPYLGEQCEQDSILFYLNPLHKKTFLLILSFASKVSLSTQSPSWAGCSVQVINNNINWRLR